MERLADRAHETRAEDAAAQRRQAQRGTRAAGDEGEVVAGERAEAAREERLLAFAHDVDQLARVDADGAGERAQAVARAKVAPDAPELARQLSGGAPRGGIGLAQFRQARDLALDDDALAGRERVAVRDAVHLAETALDAAVHERMHARQRLEAGDIALRVFVEDHARIEDVVRVEEFLHVLHQLVRLVAPLHAHERRHVASRAVFGLERALVFFGDELHHGAHHAVVLRHGLGRVEALVEDEVPVAL